LRENGFSPQHHFDMPRVLLFGAGGVGSIYAYVLKSGGASVTAVCRSNYEAVKNNGFTINSAIWGKGIQVKPDVVRTPEEAAGTIWDYVILCSKAMPGSNPSTPDIIKPAISPQTTIVLCQNGIRIENEFAKAFPNNAIISGAVYLPVTQTSPGFITHGHIERLEVGTYPANAPAAHKESVRVFADIFTAGKGTINVFDDVQPRRWNKLITNASWNPLCALSRIKDIHLLTSTPSAKKMVFGIMLEVVIIAQACGYTDVTEKSAHAQMDRVVVQIPDRGIYPSMVGDALAMRPMEVEAIVGNTLRIAQEKGVDVPLLELTYMLIKSLDDSNRQKRTELV
jgi:2-dehydropantoate 2-reductase